MSARRICPRFDDRGRILSEHSRYLKDESGVAGGIPSRIFIPTSLEELCAAVEETAASDGRLTVSGARTGLVGGAVPDETADLVVLDRLAGSLSLFYSEELSAMIARVPASMTHAALEETLSRIDDARGWFYPVDPTETTASLGGSVATNASGAHTYHYGPTRRWVAGLTVVLADGSVARLSRSPGARVSAGAHPAAVQPGAARPAAGIDRARTALIESEFFDGRRKSTRLILPDVHLPDTKNTAGYFTHGEPVDLFIGGEGTLGIIAGVDLMLSRRPSCVAGVCAFPSDRDACLDLVDMLKGSGLSLLALEYMDSGSLALLEQWRREGGGVPRTPEGAGAMLYVEAECGTGGAEEALSEISAILGKCGIGDESAWAAAEPADFKRIKALRHALPERVNDVIARRAACVPGLTKLASDLAVPSGALRRMMAVYEEAMTEGRLSYVLFGHIGDSHLHLNILAETADDLERGRRACEELARSAKALGGSVSAEHGIGRLKKRLMPVQFSMDECAALRKVKASLDPDGVLNPGVIW